MRTTIVHDKISQLGGSELVTMELADLFKAPEIQTLIFENKSLDNFWGSYEIKTSWLQKIPGINKNFRWFAPFMPAAIESLQFKGVDLVISSASSFAKGVITPVETLHICYCHTPTRYLWSEGAEYTKSISKLIGNQFLSNLLLSKLRQWDYLATKRVDVFIANSKFIAKKIKKYYRRQSKVIYPPVALDKFNLKVPKKDYFVVLSRLEYYKRIDLVIKAFNNLNLPLIVLGTGRQLTTLQKMANDNITFLGYVSERKKREILAEAQALIHPQIEDFGLTMVESLASGTPVIAYNKGGALEIIQNQANGLFFEEQIWEAIAEAILRFKKLKFNREFVKISAQPFSRKKFRSEMKSFVYQAYEKFQAKT